MAVLHGQHARSELGATALPLDADTVPLVMAGLKKRKEHRRDAIESWDSERDEWQDPPPPPNTHT